MTEQEMLEAAKYIAKRDDEMHVLRAALAAAHAKLFDAGRSFGVQQAILTDLLHALEDLVAVVACNQATQAASAAIGRAREWMDPGQN